jgi:preprotein translocase subunit SecY
MATAQPAGKAGPRYGDLKRRLVFLVLALVVYRLGTHIPVPGICFMALKFYPSNLTVQNLQLIKK